MIGLVDVAKDSGLQFRDGPERPTPGTLPCELGKEALHGVEPGRRRRSEVEGPARMPSEHSRTFGCCGSHNCRQQQGSTFVWEPGPDGAEEVDELLMPVARHAAAGHLAFQDVESSEQGCGAMGDAQRDRAERQDCRSPATCSDRSQSE